MVEKAAKNSDGISRKDYKPRTRRKSDMPENHYDPNGISALLGTITQQMKTLSDGMSDIKRKLDDRDAADRQSEKQFIQMYTEHTSCFAGRQEEKRVLESMDKRVKDLETIAIADKGPKKFVGIIVAAVVTSLLTGGIVLIIKMGAEYQTKETVKSTNTTTSTTNK